MNPSQLIDQQIAGVPDWRGQILTKLRQLIHQADPEITEEWKWDTAIFTHRGMVCAISAFKNHVKINFFKGAFLTDNHKLFNSGFDSKQHRAIDFQEGDTINESALQELIRTAIDYNKKK